MDQTIARKIPAQSELTKSKSANAALYGLTVDEYSSACQDWLENEGFDGEGNAYDNVYQWLTLPHNRNIETDLIDGGRGAGTFGQKVD